jgi:hypothetical protein
MNRNMTGTESLGRVIAGLVFLSLGFFIEWPGVWELPFFLIGAVALATGVVRYCPVKRAMLRSRRT